MILVAFQVKTLKIEILKARGPGQICSSSLSRAKIREMHRIFGPADAYVDTFLNFGGPAGGSAPGKVLRPQE